MKKAVVLCLMAAMFIWLRCELDKLPIITRYVGVINIIALAYVVVDIFIQIRTQIKSRMKGTSIPKKTQQERVRKINRVGGAIIVAIVVLGVLYILHWVSGTMNDVLSIIALLLSLISDETVELFTNRDI